MVEVELKFQLPESKKTVQQYLKHKAQYIHLQAKYYDTPDRLLAKWYGLTLT